MTRFPHILLTLACAALVAVLLDTGHAGAAPTPEPDNPFVGAWAGSFTTSSGGFGPIEFQISESGVLRGGLVNLANGISGNLTGAVNKHGFGSAHLKNPPNINIPYLIDVHIDGSGNLIGSYSALCGFNFTGEFVLSPQ